MRETRGSIGGPAREALAPADDLRARVEQAEETLRAITTGEVDALVVTTSAGPQVFTLETAEAAYRVMLEEMSEGVASVSEDGLILYANRRFVELTTGPSGHVVGRHLASVLASGADVADSLLTGEGTELDVPLVAGASSQLGIHVSSTRLPAASGAAWCVVVSNTTKRTERLAAIVEHALDAILIADLDGRILSVNQAATKICGYSKEELLRMTVWDLIASGDLEHAATELAVSLGGGPERPVSLEIVTKDGTPVHVEVTGRIISTDGAAGSMELIARDVTEKRRLEAQLTRQATHDALTGLPNRVLFLDRLDRALEHLQRHGGQVAVGVLDLDNFKLVNDTLGHEAGDHLLAELAPRLVRALRASDTIARLGGDEFAVLFGGSGSIERVVAAARRLLGAFSDGFVSAGREQVLGASLGIAVALPGQTTVQLLRNADVAMYRAKRSGRGRYELYDAAMRAELERRLDMQNEIARAIEQREIRVVYQPIYDLESGRVLGAEALARRQRAGGDLVPAAEFIEAIEEFGLTRQLGEQVVSEVIAFLTRCGSGSDDLPWGIFVNLTANEIADDDFVQWLEVQLRDHDLPAGAFGLELTERVLGQEAERCADNLARLRDAGVLLSVDDFGTGYSGLGSLLDSPFSAIKIDRSFVEQLSRPSASSIVLAMIDLAHALHLRVIAEGIETQAQRKRLRTMHCDAGQGYHLARPLPEEEFRALLARAEPPSRGPPSRGEKRRSVRAPSASSHAG